MIKWRVRVYPFKEDTTVNTIPSEGMFFDAIVISNPFVLLIYINY